MNPVIMHINFGEIQYANYGNKSIADICKMAADIGYDGIEFREQPPVELRDSLSFGEYLGQIAQAKKDTGLSHIMLGIHVIECMSTDKDTRLKCAADAVERMRMANDILGTTVFNCLSCDVYSPIKTKTRLGYEFHGSSAATEEQWKLTADTFQYIGKELEIIGARLAFETHMNYIHDLPESSMRLVRMIDSPMIGINMDFGNTVYFPEHPSVSETIDIYGDKLFYTHLKNSTLVGDVRLPAALSDGEINHRIYLTKLKEVGYSGPIGIEAPRPGDRCWFAQKDFEYYQAVVSAI